MLKQYIPWLLLIASLIYITQCQQEPVRTFKILRDTVTVFDTVYVPKDYPIEVVRYVKSPTIYRVDTVENIVFNYYSDTTEVEPQFYLTYNAKVRGQLEDISLSFYDNRPERVVRETKTITETHYSYLQGLYGGLRVSTSGNISPSLMYSKNRYVVDLSYDLKYQSVSVGLFMRIKHP